MLEYDVYRRYRGGIIMRLEKLLSRLSYTVVCGDVEVDISDVIYDSRKVCRGCVFVCLEGASFDGHDFAQAAIDAGAAAVVAGRDIKAEGAAVIRVDDTRKALAFMSAEYFGRPADTLTTIGITGTKGKTTTACMIRSILEVAGMKTGVIGTLGIIIGDKLIKTANTTPESYEIQKAMRQMIDEGCKCVVMEASSLGLKWHRTDGFCFDYGLFTNFSHDHIGGVEHADMEEYAQCKAMLFRQCLTGIMNIDDPAYTKMLEDHTCRVETFGFSDMTSYSVVLYDIDSITVGCCKDSAVFSLIHRKNVLVVKTVFDTDSRYNFVTVYIGKSHITCGKDSSIGQLDNASASASKHTDRIFVEVLYLLFFIHTDKTILTVCTDPDITLRILHEITDSGLFQMR